MSAREISPVALDYGPKRSSSPPPIGVSHLCPTSDAVFQSKQQLQSFSPIGSPINEEDVHSYRSKSAPRRGSYGMTKPYDLFCSDSLEMMQFITMNDKSLSLVTSDTYDDGYGVNTTWNGTEDTYRRYFSPLITEHSQGPAVKYPLPPHSLNRELKYSSSAPTPTTQCESFLSKSTIAPPPSMTMNPPNLSHTRKSNKEWLSPIPRQDNSLYLGRIQPQSIEHDYDMNRPNDLDTELPLSEPAWMEEWLSGMGGMELEESKLDDRGAPNSLHQAIHVHGTNWDSNLGGNASNMLMMMGKNSFVQTGGVQHNVSFKAYNPPPYPFTPTVSLPPGLHTNLHSDQRGRSSSPSQTIYGSSKSRSNSPTPQRMKRSQSPSSHSPSPSPSQSPPRSPMFKHNHRHDSHKNSESDQNMSYPYYNTHLPTNSPRHPRNHSKKHFNSYTKDSILLLSQSAPNVTAPSYEYQTNPTNRLNRYSNSFSIDNHQQHQQHHHRQMSGNTHNSHIHLNTPASSPSSSPSPSPLSSPTPTRSNSSGVISPPSPSSSPSHHHSQYRYRHKSKANRHRRRSTRKEDDLMRFEIYLEKVNAGEDVRTTLMIKNIPNKYDQEMLLETLNKKFKGTYDFFYLPIDFKNKCNVGYAFINFIASLTVAKFYEEFNQQKWEKFNSEKVCRITYARIQGKISFIDHFRNSSLMYEDPSCRPLIFHSNGPSVGTIEQFPPANISPARTRVNGSNNGNISED